MDVVVATVVVGAMVVGAAVVVGAVVVGAFVVGAFVVAVVVGAFAVVDGETVLGVATAVVGVGTEGAAVVAGVDVLGALVVADLDVVGAAVVVAGDNVDDLAGALACACTCDGRKMVVEVPGGGTSSVEARAVGVRSCD